MSHRLLFSLGAIALLATLSGCATQPATVVEPEAAGFWSGVGHGFILPFAFIGSLFSDTIALYAVPNNGGWYNFGYFIGVTVLGGGAWGSSRNKR